MAQNMDSLNDMLAERAAINARFAALEDPGFSVYRSSKPEYYDPAGDVATKLYNIRKATEAAETPKDRELRYATEDKKLQDAVNQDRINRLRDTATLNRRIFEGSTPEPTPGMGFNPKEGFTPGTPEWNEELNRLRQNENSLLGIKEPGPYRDTKEGSLKYLATEEKKLIQERKDKEQQNERASVAYRERVNEVNKKFLFGKYGITDYKGTISSPIFSEEKAKQITADAKQLDLIVSTEKSPDGKGYIVSAIEGQPILPSGTGSGQGTNPRIGQSVNPRDGQWHVNPKNPNEEVMWDGQGYVSKPKATATEPTNNSNVPVPLRAYKQTQPNYEPPPDNNSYDPRMISPNAPRATDVDLLENWKRGQVPPSGNYFYR